MKKIFLIGVAVFIIYFIVLCVTTHESYFPAPGEMFVNEYWDRSVHYLRGSWYPLHKAPYKEVFSEQLPVATYLFALPFVFMPKYDLEKTSAYFTMDSFPLGDESFPLVKPSLYKSFYMSIFSFFMVIFGLISLYLFLLFLKVLGKNLNYAFLFLLPTVLYFVLNRFDIFPALVCLLSFYSLYKERYNLAAVLLGIGMMTKAYILLCLPIFLVYYYSKYKKVNFKMIVLFVLTAILVTLPVLISGGIEALKVPFHFQMQRTSNYESLYFMLSLFLPVVFERYLGFMNLLFLVLSLSVLPFAILAKIDNLKALFKWSLLAILVFMLSMKFYSPQWILWVIFLLILNIQTGKDIFKIILFQVVNYLCFPVAFVFYGPSSIQFIILATIRIILLLSFIVPLAGELLPSSKLYIFLRRFRLSKIR